MKEITSAPIGDKAFIQYNNNSLQITSCGKRDCSDMHSSGPIVRQVYIIHYVIKGSGYLEYDQKRFFIRAGESFLICPYVTIYYYPNPEDPWEYTWVDFCGSEASEYLHMTVMNRNQPICLHIDKDRILPLYERLSGLQIFRDNRKESNGLLLAILGVYADIYPAPESKSTPKSDKRLDTALLLIQSHYHDTDFNFEKICEMVPCNRVTLYRLFQNAGLPSPSIYLTEYRIHQACKMLSKGILVKITALSCGFEDPFYFSRVFKRQMGMSPAEYSSLSQKDDRIQET